MPMIGKDWTPTDAADAADNEAARESRWRASPDYYHYDDDFDQDDFALEDQGDDEVEL